MARSGGRCARPLGEGSAAEHLADGVLTGLERVAGGAQVEAPDPQPLAPGQALGLVAVGVEPGGPVAQRLGVIGVEVLDVQRLEAGPLEGGEHPREVEELAVRKDVAVGELAADVRARIALQSAPDRHRIALHVGMRPELESAAHGHGITRDSAVDANRSANRHHVSPDGLALVHRDAAAEPDAILVSISPAGTRPPLG